MINFLKYIIVKNWKEYKLQDELKKRYPTCSFARNIKIEGPLDNLKLGKNVIIQSNVFLHLGGMDWCQNTGSLEIGDESILSPNTLIYAAGPGGVSIGDRFDCGPGSAIFASRSDYKNRGNHIFKPIVIGNDVILYSNVVLSPGVKIGNGVCIAAGSVVIKNIPDQSFAAGIPAKIKT